MFNSIEIGFSVYKNRRQITTFLSIFLHLIIANHELRNTIKMNMIFLLLLGTMCSLGLTYQVNEKEPHLQKQKLPLRPGDLLRSLDALTSDAQVIYSPLQQETHQNQAERRVYHDDDDESVNDNQESGSEYDYDKAYENFVNKYFAQGEKELESEEPNDDEVGEKAEEIDDAAPYGYSDEVEDEPKEGKQSSGSKKCEHVKIDNQNCKICEDSITNEKSKTCSYSSADDKPKSYGYSKERSTKHSTDDEDENHDDDGGGDDKISETGRSFKRETSPKNKKKFQPRRTSIEQFLKTSHDDTSKCSRKLEGGMICFYCGSSSENTRECIADENNLKKRRLDESSKKDSATKKIFKRMVTYSFKNDAEPKFKKNTYSAFKGY